VLPLYCICQAKERSVSQAHQRCLAALRPVPEMDLHMRCAPQDDLYRQRLGLWPDIHFQIARLWRMKYRRAIVLRRRRQERRTSIRPCKTGAAMANLLRLPIEAMRELIDNDDRGRYVATPSLPCTLLCDILIKLAS
jgi:hypothetical protein